MWELDHKEGWVLKNWGFQIVVLEKTLERPLDYKEIKPVNPKGNQLWIFIERTDAEAEAPTLWPPEAKSRLTGNRPWCWERLKAGGEGDDRGWDGWMASLTRWTWVWAKLREMVKDREAWFAADHGVAKSGTWLNNNNNKRSQDARITGDSLHTWLRFLSCLKLCFYTHIYMYLDCFTWMHKRDHMPLLILLFGLVLPLTQWLAFARLLYIFTRPLQAFLRRLCVAFL